MHNYRNYAWLCMIWAHSFGPGPNGPILRFCHEWGQNKRWGAVRHAKRSGIAIRVYLVLKNIANISKHSPKCSKKIKQHSWKPRFSKSISLGMCKKCVERVSPPIPDQFRWKIGVRDCPYGICSPWVRGGWDLDALGKSFRRRRRRLGVPT